MHRKSGRPAKSAVITYTICFAVMLFLCFSAQPGAALEQNTAFLPLKINAAQQDLALRVDAAMEQALAAKGLQMISRSEAEKLVSYDREWPPGPSRLSAVAEQSGYDYVAAGSLTVAGKQFSIDLQVFDVLSPATPHAAFRQGQFPTDLDQAVTDAVSDALAYANSSFIIASIAPAGNERIDSGAILRQIKTKPGDLYDPATLRQDLKAVFAMGYFDNVEIEAEDTDKGKVIIFRVKEKPLISRIVISGTDEIEEEEVREAANIKENTILNPARLNNAVQRIRELYKSKGYYRTKVSAKLSYPSEERVEVRFVVQEGEKMSIKKITFQGNKSFDSDDLEDVIQTGTWGLFSWLTESGLLKMDVLRQDAARLGAFYHNHGFIEAKVGEPVVEEKGGDLFVTFPIEEGPRYRVGTVDIQGDLIEDKATLLAKLKIRKEPFLNRQVLREDTLRLSDLYSEHGYAFAEITPDIKKSASGKRVDITLHVDKGSLVYFNRVEIRGNTRTRDNVIRRDLLVKEGGLFDSRAIRRSTQKLQRLNYFEEVSITPQPTMNEDQMNVIVEVKEKSTGQFSIGAGYSSSDYVMVMGEISENNFLGMGTRLALKAHLSGVTSRFNLSYTDPRIFDSDVSAGIDLFNWRRVYDDYTKDSYGGGVRFGHYLWEKWRIYYGYTWSDTTLSDVSEDASWAIRKSMDINITSAVRFTLVRDTRDRLFDASKGSKHSLSVKYAGGPLGGDAQFTRVEGYTSWYFPLFLDTVFHVKAAAGQAFENEDDKLPVYEHFYLGGMNSIRGFKSTSISPIDPETGDRVGGDKMWYANIEFVFPLLKEAGLRGVIFTDFGNVYGVDEDWDFGEIKKSAGVGVRWLSPMGPLRLVWGYNLDKQEGDQDATWDFAMGGYF